MIDDACIRQEIEATTRDVCRLFFVSGAQLVGGQERPRIIMLLDIAWPMNWLWYNVWPEDTYVD